MIVAVRFTNCRPATRKIAKAIFLIIITYLMPEHNFFAGENRKGPLLIEMEPITVSLNSLFTFSARGEISRFPASWSYPIGFLGMGNGGAIMVSAAPFRGG